jgi:hypothetical protein
MPLDDLIDELQKTTEQLVNRIEEVAVDEGAYHRQFWAAWEKIPADSSIAAANRECERACAALDEQLRLSRAVRDALTVKRDALVAVLGARTK